jgi:16S rRNA G966 N2-methylase RsmD
MAHVKLTPEVRSVLERSTITGNQLQLPGQLDRKLYEAVMRVISNCGGKWNRSAGAHVFACDPRAKLGLALDTGVAQDDKKTFQFFPTPPELAAIVVARACVGGQTVLEPSAGSGALVRECIREGAHQLAMIEINPEHRQSLQDVWSVLAATVLPTAHCQLHIADFLSLTPATMPSGSWTSFDRVVMNPPFAKGQDLKHIAHAARHFLKPGGRLVSIMLPHEYAEIDAAIGDNYSYTTEDIEAGAFKSSGTNIRTQLLVLDKGHEPEPLIAALPQPAKQPRSLAIQRPDDVWASL